MQTIPLGPGFAAEVHGVGLAEVAADDAAYAAVRAALDEHSVLVFRAQPVTDALQVAYSERFGQLELAKAASLGEGTPFSILTNIDPLTKQLVPADHKEALRARANQLWHTDSSFKDPPALASVLSARVIPPHGGETEFVSMRLAWDRLPAAERDALEQHVASHDYAHSRGKIAPHLASSRERSTLPPVRWRTRWRNPVNGRKALYVASHTCGIEGQAPTTALPWIERLIDDATRLEHRYVHRWQTGDVVMWDNRAVLHRGRPFPEDCARYMARTTISAVDADGVADLRPSSTAVTA